ncbi:MAG: hypothetical protein ABW110_14090, partial [Steroidobacteraceae bacterium]
KRRRLMELHHAERMAAIERGMDIPPLPIEPHDERRPQTGLLRGLVCSLVGAALVGSWLIAHNEWLGVSGLVVAAVGVAHLIYYAIEGRKRSSTTTTVVVGAREELR